MIYVQITTPVLPKKATQAKIISLVKKTVKDTDCKVEIFESGIDSYGQRKFDILVMDRDRWEQQEIRNDVMTAIFSVLYNN
jgi:hypothetical protein